MKSKGKHSDICRSCNETFYYTNEDIWFDDKSCGFSVKLVKCSHCGAIKVIRYYENENLDVNNDERYYEYSN